MPGAAPGSSAVVPLVVLAAAVLHAAWNALAHAIRDKLIGFVLIGLAITGCGLVGVFLAPHPDRAAWPYIAVSTLLQVGYQVLLLQTYRLGDFGQLYPIARGTSPLLVAVVSATALGQPLSGGGVLGVLVICLGLAGLALADGLPGRAQRPALAAALGTGVLIASYTIVDGVGVRHAGSVLGYLAWLFLFQGAILPLAALAVRGRALFTQARPHLARGLTGGVLSLLAYGLVVWAQSRGSLATVAALRETSIVIGAAIGALVFHESVGRRRITASAAVLAGIAMLELTHG
ncbi:EamA family transporter [Kitasatospora sp. LaBMicrA B282]|uniref:EamA family transporter n=1 Tax=Kitasatospora sp. LaBMicrA B282 TaxID=3420949 RepID=UPI003D10AE0E